MQAFAIVINKKLFVILTIPVFIALFSVGLIQALADEETNSPESNTNKTEETNENKSSSDKDANENKNENMNKTRLENLREVQKTAQERLKKLREAEWQDFQEKQEQFREQQKQRQEDFLKQVEEKREALKTALEQKREEFKQSLEKIKDARKKTIVERIDGNMGSLNERLTNHFTEVLKKLDGILERISVRADKAEANGTDVAAVRTAVTVAQGTIASARSAVEEQVSKTYDIQIQDESTLKSNVGETRKKLRDDLAAIHATVKTAYTAVRAAATTLAQIPKVDEMEVEQEGSGNINASGTNNANSSAINGN